MDWTHDDLGRVLTETWINADTSTANVLTFAYDANGNMLTAEDDDGTYTQTFDNQDRLETIDGLFGVSLTFAYDALSRRTWVEDSFGGVMSSVYDAAGRLEKRQFGGTSMATLTYERDYADNGEMLAARRYSDLSSTNLIGSTTYGYDAAYRLTNLQHKDGSGSNIANYTMTFDAGGRITEENRNGTSVTYTYDTRSQLTQASSDGYSYDDNGNRTMAGYSTGGMNQLLNDGTFTYTYDLEGNVSTKSKGTGLETWYYGFDHNNRLLSVRKTSDGSTNTLTVTYAYDVFGNRVREGKWSSGPGLVTTKFVYLGQEVYLDLDNADDVLMRYIQGDTADEMIVRIDGGNVVAWFLADRLGSIRDIVDDGGTVIDSITYDAYGKITAETNSANRGRYGSFGMELDTDTVMVHAVWRDLDLLTARWGGTDQTWFKPGDANLYRYAGNNPTNATDPSGLDVILLYRPLALGGEGHLGILIRLADGKWVLRSFTPAVGLPIAPGKLETLTFDSLEAAKKSDDNAITFYKQFVYFKTTDEAAKKALDEINKTYGGEKPPEWNYMGPNCATLAVGALKASGIEKAELKTKKVKELNKALLDTLKRIFDKIGRGAFDKWLMEHGDDLVPAPIPTYKDAEKNWGGKAGKWPDDAKE